MNVYTFSEEIQYYNNCEIIQNYNLINFWNIMYAKKIKNTLTNTNYKYFLKYHRNKNYYLGLYR